MYVVIAVSSCLKSYINGNSQIWSLDGRIVQVLDRSFTQSMGLDPSGPDQDISRARIQPCVRDVSWHSQVGQPSIYPCRY